jgi:hypothetical protein
MDRQRVRAPRANPAPSPQPGPAHPPAEPEKNAQQAKQKVTQFKRAIAREYRNAIAKSVCEDLFDIIEKWVKLAGGDHKDDAAGGMRGDLALQLHLDVSTFHAMRKEATLPLPILTQILVQWRRDFTELHYGPVRGDRPRDEQGPLGRKATTELRHQPEPDEVIIGPVGAQWLEMVGAAAALTEGYLRKRTENEKSGAALPGAALPAAGDGRKRRETKPNLEPEEARLLSWMFVRGNRERLEHKWFAEEADSDKLLIADLKKGLPGRYNCSKSDLATVLEGLATEWSAVCVEVIPILEQHTAYDIENEDGE